MGQLTLVLGGIRSGKSRLAEQLAAAHPPVVYLATALAGDEEMRRRIQQHRQRRPSQWQTVECSSDLAEALTEHRDAGCVLVECVTLWLTNLMLGIPGHPARSDREMLGSVDKVLEAVSQVSGRVIAVSNEIGLGVVPVEGLARRFGDVLGETNQRLAAAATEVHLCVAGLSTRLK